MDSFLGRYRNLTILVIVLSLQLLGLAVQVKTGTNERKDTRLIRYWAVGAITPFERGLVWVQNGVGNVWHNYFYLRGVRAENRQLKDQIEQMRLQQVRLSEDAAQAHRLQILLGFKEQFISKTVAAQVIGSSGSDLSRIVSIDKGKRAGIEPDMAVITADGVVGKVLISYPNEAQVLLISDQSSGVGATLEKTRLQGVIRGTANGEVTLERVMSDEQVQAGETVLTSGGDRVFPKGLPIGTVTKVEPGRDLFLNIKIRPAANLGRLEEVLVLTEKQEREAVAEDHGRMRAADILAQRLPSVPDKPATDASATTATAGTATNSANASSAPKPNSTTAGAVKGASGNAAPKPGAPATQPAKTTAQTPAIQKPKPVNTASTESKPEPAQAQPSIVEQKPVGQKSVEPKPASVAPSPDTPQPPQDNSSPQ
jgi:rod shape-determining protein MreC